ncbi:hypothetical protein KUTeg_002686 [Tegillarca granosa]|uniref:Uncharacterized protein n=1 Tax=Tegillarca granosa TaxID=220873 RepID=A0ABQ9FV20_TEGGR|nr:hypothetical protein KUTeg_002686 [Tegillarca granosa]
MISSDKLMSHYNKTFLLHMIPVYQDNKQIIKNFVVFEKLYYFLHFRIKNTEKQCNKMYYDLLKDLDISDSGKILLTEHIYNNFV